jgi:hypothetical protein
MNTIKFTYPKGTSTSAELTKKIKGFREGQKPPPISSLAKKELDTATPVRGVNLMAKDVKMLHNIASSRSPLADAVSNEEVSPEQIIGTLSSALITLEFVKMQGAFKKAMDGLKNEADKKTLNDQWKGGIQAFKNMYATIGLKDIEEKNMIGFSSALLKNKNAFNSVVNIDNSRQLVKTAATRGIMNDKSIARGKFETEIDTVPDPVVGNIGLPKNLCSTPFAQGSFTKHFGHSFSLRVTLTLPCIKWGGPFGCHCIPYPSLCTNTYTLASLSYNVDLSVGYKVTCCGGSAWGFASANVCGSILGITVCAGCTASIIGAVGIARTPSGGNCIYGLGLNAQLKCTFAGITVLYVNVPFGYTFTGPCPPLPC